MQPVGGQGTDNQTAGYPALHDPEATDPGLGIQPLAAAADQTAGPVSAPVPSAEPDNIQRNGVVPAEQQGFGGPAPDEPAVRWPRRRARSGIEARDDWAGWAEDFPDSGHGPEYPVARWPRWRRARGGIKAQDDWAEELAGPEVQIVRKVPLISIAVLVVLVLVAGIAAAGYLRAKNDLNGIRRLGNPFASIPPRLRPPPPTGAAAKGLTFLVVGLDTRSAAAGNSASGIVDALMLVRLIPGGTAAYVVSVPRDSWVPIPAHRNGKVDSAYALGGAALTIRTVERLTNVRIDHFAMIDWTGIPDVTDALGGVTVRFPVSTHDPARPVTWTAGLHLDGAQALQYIRPSGSAASADLGDEARLQEYLRALFQQARRGGTLANPLRAVSVLNALPGAVSLDNTLNDSQLLHLAQSLRGMRTSQVVFAAAPSLGTGSAAGQSIVRLNHSVGQGFWHAFDYDSLPAFMQQHGLKQLGPPGH